MLKKCLKYLRRIGIAKHLRILTKKDWTVYAAVNIGVIMISLGFIVWTSYEAKLAEEYRLSQKLAVDMQLAKAEAEAAKQAFRDLTILGIQDVIGLDREIARKILEEAERYDTLTSELIVAVMYVESSYNPAAVSHAGALGIMQVMPLTGSWLADRLETPFEVEMLYDPIYNIELACFYLDFLIEYYEHDLHTALTAYNRGISGLERYQEAHQRTSSSYSEKVIELSERFKADANFFANQ